MMKDVQAVSVMYHGRKVGTLSMGNRSNCQFEYDKDWLTDGFSISPLKLPLKAGLFTADYEPFNGNFGVFEDSLPGGYGEYLLRKVLKKSGIDPQSLNPVQWLSIIGSSGMGALCYVPETKLQQEDSLLSLDEMQEIALNVLSSAIPTIPGIWERWSINIIRLQGSVELMCQRSNSWKVNTLP